MQVSEIVSQHAEEAAFLWLLRDDAVRQPHYNLADLAELDERVEAHLDGLRVNGDPAWEIAKEQLESIGEAGEVFAAGVIAFETGDAERIAPVVEIGAASQEVARGLVSALGWLPQETALPHIQAMLRSDAIHHRCAGIAAAAVQRWNPESGFGDGLRSDEPLFKARALRAVGELGDVELLHAVCQSIESEDPNCKFWAAWSGVLLGRDEKAVRALRLLALDDGPHCERGVKLLFRAEEPLIARKMIDRLRDKPKTLRLAVVAAGVTGDPEYVPWLFEQMAGPEIARVAGEAFSMITGVDIAYDNMEGEWPEGFEAGPTENPEDEDVDMDDDENLPWPNVELLSHWWDRNKKRFSRGNRYLVGKPITVDSLHEILRTSMQRQRAAAALEIALRNPGRPLFEVRMPGKRQQRLLAST